MLNIQHEAINQGRWLKIGKLELEEELKHLPQTVLWTKLSHDYFQIMSEDGRKTYQVSFEECKNLRIFVLLHPKTAKKILEDYFNGRGDLLKKRYGVGALKFLLNKTEN